MFFLLVETTACLVSAAEREQIPKLIRFAHKDSAKKKPKAPHTPAPPDQPSKDPASPTQDSETQYTPYLLSLLPEHHLQYLQSPRNLLASPQPFQPPAEKHPDVAFQKKPHEHSWSNENIFLTQTYPRLFE